MNREKRVPQKNSSSVAHVSRISGLLGYTALDFYEKRKKTVIRKTLRVANTNLAEYQ